MRKYLTIPLLVISALVHAQMVNSGSQMSVAQGTTLGIDMDFLNTGTLKNQGDIYLTGNWMNVGVYDSAGGQLIFNSTGVQQIMNNGQEINKLVIRNGIKTLNDDLTITGELSLNSAILQVEGEARLTLGQGAIISGANENAYINGTLYRIGNDDLFYPIGTQSRYLPVTLKEVLGIKPEIGMKAFSEPPFQGIGDNLQEFAADTYWQLFSSDAYASGFIELPYKDVVDIRRLVVAQATSESSLYNTLGSSQVDGDQSAGVITSEGNAIGAYFTLALAPETNPLPPLKIINVLTPLQDGKHDFLRIENIELYPDNKVEIFDRHGNKVFSLANYNNRDRVFIGEPNHGISGQLPDGNYFYTIKTGKTKVTSGFIFLKR